MGHVPVRIRIHHWEISVTNEMHIDIIDRLRISWTSMSDKANAERLQAAEEIERLRNALRAIADNKNNEPYAADYARDFLNGEIDANKP